MGYDTSQSEGPSEEMPGWTSFKGGWQGRPRAPRGGMAHIIMHVLSERPMHGYEIIRTLEERSHGFWRPSAGSIYPTLQLLEEQELVASHEEGGKKIYSLTEKGKEQAASGKHANPWERKHHSAVHFREVAGSFRGIMFSLKHIASHGSKEQMAEAKRILNEASKSLADLAEKSSGRESDNN